MQIKSHANTITTAVLFSAASLVFTACSSMHSSSGASYSTTGSETSMSEPSGASASSSSEWKRGTAGQQYQSSEYSAGASTSANTSSESETSTAQSNQRSSQADNGAAQGDIRIPLHRETVNVGKRTVDAGQVVLRKIVTTETVNQPVELRRETVVIDRVDSGAQQQSSASAQANTASAPFEEKTFTIRLQREEPVVQKQTVVTGNVVARREAQTERTNIREQVRKEDVQLDRSGAGENVVVHGDFVNEGAGAQRPAKDQQRQNDQDQQQTPKQQ